jgi:hypothetical protein
MRVLINKEVAEASRGTPLAEAQVAATKTAVPYLRNSAVKFFFYYIKVCKSLGKFICTFASHRQRVVCGNLRLCQRGAPVCFIA